MWDINYNGNWHKTNKMWLIWWLRSSCGNRALFGCVCAWGRERECVYVLYSAESHFHVGTILCHFVMYFQWSLVLASLTNGFVIRNLIADISCVSMCMPLMAYCVCSVLKWLFTALSLLSNAANKTHIGCLWREKYSSSSEDAGFLAQCMVLCFCVCLFWMMSTSCC